MTDHRRPEPFDPQDDEHLDDLLRRAARRDAPPTDLAARVRNAAAATAATRADSPTPPFVPTTAPAARRRLPTARLLAAASLGLVATLAVLFVRRPALGPHVTPIIAGTPADTETETGTDARTPDFRVPDAPAPASDVRLARLNDGVRVEVANGAVAVARPTRRPDISIVWIVAPD